MTEKNAEVFAVGKRFKDRENLTKYLINKQINKFWQMAGFKALGELHYSKNIIKLGKIIH